MRKNGPGDFTLLVASAQKDGEPLTADLESGKGTLKVEYGDFSDALSKAVAALKEAKKYVANDHQSAMIDGYIKS